MVLGGIEGRGDLTGGGGSGQVPFLLAEQRAGGWPVVLLCSRNARPEKDGMGGLVVLLLAERAR
jgi:hypothetical protein